MTDQGGRAWHGDRAQVTGDNMPLLELLVVIVAAYIVVEWHPLAETIQDPVLRLAVAMVAAAVLVFLAHVALGRLWPSGDANG